MKRIFIFPTIEEAKAFILTQPRDPVFVAGVGAAEIAAATIRAVKARKPQLVVLAGIAGAYDRTLRRGEVVEVVTERIAGIPARYAREYETTGPDLGLPLAAGVTVNRSGEGLRDGLSETPSDTLPEIENMEGAAFFAVCEALGVACCQIRAVSNYVGEPFGRWAVGQAVENLTATLTQIFGNDE
ncbi:MAG: hypothetical protein LUC96_03645 [Alistipes sp.]|uniref:phosphorylase family protein n=1 Tax=Alistipes sp. TaxID=1872444 RepID=UPI0025C4257F|nr:hypothetical protein [Alistipes sp.]MCD8274069.1 hypothetical protein [Alistipes sp.]